ncbi:LAFA_0F12244g1_1 [Lachancea sp. 'fantastica']|nr:LAFA_0F12244g1_1 [Lachancea sp. 'fantastica']
MAAAVGGVISGVNPFHYNASSPVTLFLIQACIILLLSNGLHLFLARLRQPKVISEVITGVILGPTALGQIPHYTNTIFPKDSVAGLNLVANLGIILFMFFLGLEVDVRFIKNHAKTAFSVGMATLTVPFGFGCLFAIPLYNTYMQNANSEEGVKFTVFMVFIAVSLSVTAFPVLCRILAELRLLAERVGIVVLAAGTINDVIGWILLALCIILSNSQAHAVNVVYILLCTFGWFLMYAFPVRYALRWSLLRMHEFERSKPSMRATLIVLLLTFISAYFTDIIGVHPIFGAFMAGLIVPRDQNYVVKLADRMEDIPNIVMIPIYFTIAGLNVDLTKLNAGRDWGFTFASIGIAVSTKVASGFLMSKLNGLLWRESLAVGVLMSCKGIVEIVVLTTGLNAGIISTKVYSMFIFMALISTFVTTPLTMWLFPKSYREELKSYLDDQEEESKEDPKDNFTGSSHHEMEHHHIERIITVLNKPELVFPTVTLLNCLVHGERSPMSSRKTISTPKSPRSDKHVTDAEHLDSVDHSYLEQQITLTNPAFDRTELRTIYLRLLTERTTDLLQNLPNFNGSQQSSNYPNDFCLETFQVFCELINTAHSGEVIFSLLNDKVNHINEISATKSDLLLFPLSGVGDLAANERPKEQLARMFAANELPANFLQMLATKHATSLVFFINNSKPEKRSRTMMGGQFYLLFPDDILTDSDHLCVHLLMLIMSKILSEATHETMKITICINSTNGDYFKDFFSRHGAKSDDVQVMALNYNLNSNSKNTSSSFVDAVFEEVSKLENWNMEGSTFVIADTNLPEQQNFSPEVEVAITRSFREHFDLVVCHKKSTASTPRVSGTDD